MLSFLDRQNRLCDKIPRREWMRVGGLGVLGLTLTDLLASRSVQAVPAANDLTKGLSGTMFGRAKNVIFLWLQGGPPQHETFDPKPDAPREIRGPFGPIQTNIPGIQFSELLPRTAQRADKLAVIRSLSTDDNNHDVSGYWVLTGYPYGPGSARQIKPTDWPYLGSVVKMLKPSERLPALSSVWLPDMMRLNDNVTPAGQTGGFLGPMWDPERFVGDPAAEDYRVEGLNLPVDLPAHRMASRSELLGQLDRHVRAIEGRSAPGNWDKLSSFALELITSGKAKAAFDLSQERSSLRDRYGRNTWGQSCLLARRLIEAGVRLVHVNWMREPGDSAVDNPLWDTHALNAERLQDFLCPVFDVSFAALLDDLDSRGLLAETLVVAVGEFGRTPKINSVGGRDHWGPVFSCALAGAGISGGQVFGASDRNGAYPIADAIRPHDLTATIYHLLGIPHDSVFHDATNRPHPITKGDPLYRLLGDQAATPLRCASAADESLVPPWDSSPIVDVDFAAGNLIPVAPVSQRKGWRATPLSADSVRGVVVRVESMQRPVNRSASFVRMGVSNVDQLPITVAAATKMVLAQEIRNARGGHYQFTVHLSGSGTSAEAFERWFAKTLTCRLVLFRFANQNKTPLEIQELASESVRPTFGDLNEPVSFSVAKFLGSTVPGANFPIGNGLGVAIVVESHVTQDIPPGEAASLCVHRVELEFQARQRDDNVTV